MVCPECKSIEYQTTRVDFDTYPQDGSIGGCDHEALKCLICGCLWSVWDEHDEE